MTSETAPLQTASYYDALAYLRPLGTLMALGAPIAFTFNVSLDLLVVKVRRSAGPTMPELTV